MQVKQIRYYNATPDFHTLVGAIALELWHYPLVKTRGLSSKKQKKIPNSWFFFLLFIFTACFLDLGFLG